MRAETLGDLTFCECASSRLVYRFGFSARNPKLFNAFFVINRFGFRYVKWLVVDRCKASWKNKRFKGAVEFCEMAEKCRGNMSGIFNNTETT